MRPPNKIKTLKTAMKWSIITWQFICDNPDKQKWDLPGYKTDTWHNNCALCEYFFNFKNVYDCESLCPLASKKLCGTAAVKSAYTKWATNILESKKKRYAGILLKALNKYNDENFNK